MDLQAATEAVHMLAENAIREENTISRLDATDEEKDRELERIERHAHELRAMLDPEPVVHEI